MRQRFPLWVLALVVLMAGVIWFWKRGAPSQSHSQLQTSNASKTTPLSVAHTEPRPLLSEPTPVDFTEVLAKAREKQNRSRYPNRLSNTTLPLKQLGATDSAI